MKLKARYKLNKDAKVGDVCICPSCGTEFTKEHYQQAFCKSKGSTVCKDKYWNTVTPNKRNNKTRISPANSAYYNSVILPQKAKERGFPDVETMLNYVDETGEFTVEVALCDFCGLLPEFCDCGEGT
jgi:hypothetical protein